MNWMALTPEYALMAGLLMNIVICSVKDRSRLVYQTFGVSLFVAFFLCFLDAQSGRVGGLLVSQSIRSLQLLVLFSAIVFWLMSKQHMLDTAYRPSSILLVQSSLMGVMVLILAQDLLNMYIGLELMSLPLYTLVAIRTWDKASLEGALKYFVTGAIASSLLLLGFALLYAISGSIDLAVIATGIQSTVSAKLFSPDLITLLGGLSIAFLVAACSFKLGLFPFHSWMPDVYQSARMDVVLWIATLPKIAIAIMITKLIGATASLAVYWQSMFLMVGLASVAFGNIMALSQDNYRRLMAYSSIAHMGFFAIAMYVISPEGLSAGLFYMVVYLLMSFVTLGVMLQVEESESFKVSQLKALMKVPQLAFVMMVAVFSLAGIPPLAGFMAKLSVFVSLIHIDQVPVAIGAVLLSVIALGYYLKMVKVMYFTDSEDMPMTVVRHSRYSSWLLLGVMGCLLYIGILPNQLTALTDAVIAQNLPH
ncbi:NADH-quinone oxidoreductase subunit N [Gammaproteobacteria bacterium]|nr:NADH-quinone oxidoreductase subunit N [Gammaproteobacteria bacterium]